MRTLRMATKHMIMNTKKRCQNNQHSADRASHQHTKGPSSFYMHDSPKAFNHLKLTESQNFLDLGCGAGDYSLHAAQLVGHSGQVYALDCHVGMLNGLKNEAEKQGLNNIQTAVADVFKPLPIQAKSIDVCMLATVLHAKDVFAKTPILFNEIKRVLKPNGRLAIIECKKEKMPFGPPIELRLAPEEIEAELSLHKFKKSDLIDLNFNYMLVFSYT